ncbi:Uncharacterized protein Rs2_19967 [Raphanus sativus]|nr:Uncharacterized protein Rs2_19967 [Raphanus sativus]
MTALKLIGRRNVTIVTPLNKFNDLNRVSRSVLIQMISRGTNLADNWTQHERADNNALKAENYKIRCENIAIREALKNAICPNCGGPPVTEDPYFNEHKLRIENAHLRDELERMSTLHQSTWDDQCPPTSQRYTQCTSHRGICP